jgi:hypothetical protein
VIHIRLCATSPPVLRVDLASMNRLGSAGRGGADRTASVLRQRMPVCSHGRTTRCSAD